DGERGGVLPSLSGPGDRPRATPAAGHDRNREARRRWMEQEGRGEEPPGSHPAALFFHPVCNRFPTTCQRHVKTRKTASRRLIRSGNSSRRSRYRLSSSPAAKKRAPPVIMYTAVVCSSAGKRMNSTRVAR